MAEQRFALVTGCGQGGIGEALVKEYARRGLRPIATLLASEPSQHLDEAGIEWFPLDVTRKESVVELRKWVEGLTGGRLDVLVNNAGKGEAKCKWREVAGADKTAYTMTAIDTDVGEVQQMFDVNLFGPMRMVHYFHDLLIQSAGIIVNIGSVGGIVPYVYGSSYNASKAALHAWSNTLRVEMAALEVLTVISGEIGTNILKSDAARQLPQDSYYSPLAQEFEKHVQRVPDTTSRFVYAEQVVAQSLKTVPAAWFWYGKTTSMVRLLDMFGWRTVFDGIFWNMFGLAKLRHGEKMKMK
ncbi:hypothetical protein CDD81_7708 [Ophiocordyceps australis]|uniref:NAD(P)-binding protein n=1 Tax=Ophiocordyceps australis TaxID=1399860 RepID=A0A2C5X8X3_9HYPO|nr:hypothetical protein CDD81_7708 [Ophiocordyceps australis]